MGSGKRDLTTERAETVATDWNREDNPWFARQNSEVVTLERHDEQCFVSR